MGQGDFFWFLERSMRLLKVEAPQNYCQMSSELGELRASIAAAANKRVAYFDGSRFIVSGEPSRCDIEVHLTDKAVIDVIDARYSLNKALREGVISVKGRLDVLDKFHWCLGIYLNGALRSRGFLKLLSEYRRVILEGR
jgi:hypothetical protein